MRVKLGSIHCTVSKTERSTTWLRPSSSGSRFRPRYASIDSARSRASSLSTSEPYDDDSAESIAWIRSWYLASPGSKSVVSYPSSMLTSRYRTAGPPEPNGLTFTGP